MNPFILNGFIDELSNIKTANTNEITIEQPRPFEKEAMLSGFFDELFQLQKDMGLKLAKG